MNSAGDMTMTELTDEQLEAVQATAGQAGDAVQVHLCAIALGQDRAGLMPLDNSEAETVARLGASPVTARKAIAASVST